MTFSLIFKLDGFWKRVLSHFKSTIFKSSLLFFPIYVHLFQKTPTKNFNLIPNVTTFGKILDYSLSLSLSGCFIGPNKMSMIRATEGTLYSYIQRDIWGWQFNNSDSNNSNTSKHYNNDLLSIIFFLSFEYSVPPGLYSSWPPISLTHLRNGHLVKW